MTQYLGAGAVLIVLLASGAMAQDRVYQFDGFTEVEVAEGVSATLNEGPFQVEATARRGNIDRLVIEQDGDVLRIERRAPVIRSALNSNDQFEVEIHMPKLIRVESRAGASVIAEVPSSVEAFEGEARHGASLRIASITADQTALYASSGASLQFNGSAGETDVTVENGSSMRLSGNCTDLSAEIRAGASLRAGEFQCHNLDISARAGAEAVVYGDQTASVEARFGASVRLLGDPVIEDMGSGFGGDIRSN